MNSRLRWRSWQVTDHFAIENVEGGEESRGSMAFVIVCLTLTQAGSQRKNRGCTIERLYRLFSSTHSTNARSGGSGHHGPGEIVALSTKHFSRNRR
jgi:hypothetical protein